LEATAVEENRALIARGSDGDRDATCRDANRNAAVVDTNIVVAVIAVVVVDNEVQDGVAIVDESLRKWFGYQNKQRKKIKLYDEIMISMLLCLSTASQESRDSIEPCRLMLLLQFCRILSNDENAFLMMRLAVAMKKHEMAKGSYFACRLEWLLVRRLSLLRFLGYDLF
jgi:hypothetical protein